MSAVIPGYGFLSENSDFARAVVGAGMVWLGPSADTIDSFGIKHTSRILAKAAGVPIVPGTEDLLPDVESAVTAAADIGYPVSSQMAHYFLRSMLIRVGHAKGHRWRWRNVSCLHEMHRHRKCYIC